MAAITVTKTQIEGLVIVQPSVFGDERGYFMETYNKEEFEKLWSSKVINNIISDL